MKNREEILISMLRRKLSKVKTTDDIKNLLNDFFDIADEFGKYKILGKADIERLADYFYKMYVNYNEKCGAAKMLEELGYITDTQYLVLTDNFEQQCFERIPVAKSTFKSILQR